MASIKLIAFIDKMGINKVIIARINIKALATAEEALIKGTAKNK